MYWGNELKLIYATIILMLEINVNTGAMEKMSSIMTENMDDLKSLEVCMARNQQRLGSVYGNFTRHHKKGHRRRTTTTIPTTVISTTELEETTTYGTTDPVSETTNAKLPKPLRLSASSLEDDYNEDNHNLDKELDEEIIDIIAKERHAKHHNRNKELIQDISETRSSHLNKVKKMYRDSTASAVNRLNAKSSKNGIFLTENCTTVLAQIGTMAVLHCEVSDITENTDWALHIRFATSADAGYYECQVPTHPPTSIFFKLVLVAAYAEIMGESEKIIHEGSMLRLVCVVRRSTEPPSYVFWYFENRMINYDLSEYNLPLCLAFVDYEKAFDSIELWAMLQSLQRCHIDYRYIEVLRCMHNAATMSVQLHEHSTKPIQLQRGVRQGDVISPKLFTCALEDVFKLVEWKRLGINVNGEYIFPFQNSTN
ncbi:unnamed protein product [Plutella xylostella]|uniref:(diamondback moth) hypothetical protein n=1 Tax=Plutella xylostella TaxID=51655 RepID=A0A8S4F145_PLUXY|nr:unnamed protein product [Plutella xylostella]